MKKLLLLALGLVVLAPALVGAQAEAEDRIELVNDKHYGDCVVFTRTDTWGIDRPFPRLVCYVADRSGLGIDLGEELNIFLILSPPREGKELLRSICSEDSSCPYALKFSSEARGEERRGEKKSGVSSTDYDWLYLSDTPSFIQKALRSTHVQIGVGNEVYTISLLGFNAAWADFQQRAGLPNP